MRRIGLAVALAFSLLLALLAGWGQETAKVPRVGVLLLDTEGLGLSQDARYVVDGLRELGWIDTRNITLRFKFAGLSEERLTRMAEELVREKVDLIVAVATSPTRAAQRATTSIPIVMAGTSDPVAAGFVKNLARPDGNITGTSLLQNTELGGKRLELLKEAVPNLVRVAVLYDSDLGAALGRTSAQIQADLQAEASRIGMNLRAATPFRGIAALPAQFAQIRAARVGALFVWPSPPIDEARSKIAELALKERLPTVCGFREYVEAGGLMSYGANLGAVHRRAAAYVDRILKGARPADLPIEQATTFELVINLKTAKTLGLTIPQTLRLQASQLIE